jgi:hypothetical protein
VLLEELYVLRRDSAAGCHVVAGSFILMIQVTLSFTRGLAGKVALLESRVERVFSASKSISYAICLLVNSSIESRLFLFCSLLT